MKKSYMELRNAHMALRKTNIKDMHKAYSKLTIREKKMFNTLSKKLYGVKLE